MHERGLFKLLVPVKFTVQFSHYPYLRFFQQKGANSNKILQIYVNAINQKE